MSETQESYTVEELARRLEIPTTTIRMYQNKKLLDPPTKQGRVGYYNEQHSARLELIASMQKRGFSLASIKELLDSWKSGESIGELLSLEKIAPTLERKSKTFTLAELTEAFGDVEMTQQELQRAVASKKLQLRDGLVEVEDVAFLEAGSGLAKMGVPLAEILDQSEILQELMAKVAAQFENVFAKYFWDEFESAGYPENKIDDVLGQLQQLSGLAQTVVTASLRQEFQKLATTYSEKARNS